MKTEMLHGMLDVVDMDQVLSGDEEHVSGWDLVYDNGYIEVDPAQCGYTSFLGTAIPEPDFVVEPVAQAGPTETSPPPKEEDGRGGRSRGRGGSSGRRR